MKTVIPLLLIALLLVSCGANKKIAALESINRQCDSLLDSATMKLSTCLAEKDVMAVRIEDLKTTNRDLMRSAEKLTSLSAKGAETIEKSLESLREKDLKISRLQDALSRKDSVTLSLVMSLKRIVGMDDPDIEVSVEKGVVYISIADRLLFNTGSYQVGDKAREVLAKVAAIVKDRPDFECMVEGHTDNVPINNPVLQDNWDLSVKRATSIVRILQDDFTIAPARLIAAGRGEYVPLEPNDTPEGKARNRRTRIIVLPKIDQFYEMIEKELRNL
jgi:chemotaxis protein MotB